MNSADTSSSDQSAESEPRAAAAPVRRRAVWWWVLAVGVVLTIALWAYRTWFGDPLPSLSPADFRVARQRWEANAPPNYDIEVVVRGSQPATYAVEVRDGRPEVALRNGQPLLQRRTFSTWSVPGMFSTMSRDVEVVERFEQGNASPSAPRLALRAEFDERFGYPTRYRRIEWGSPVEVSWEVTKFEVISSE